MAAVLELDVLAPGTAPDRRDPSPPRSRHQHARPPRGWCRDAAISRYTQEELDHAKTAINQKLAAYKKLVRAVNGATSDPKVTSPLEAFEPLFFNNMTLVLDRYFIHRLRVVTGKDGNALDEVELMSDS